MTRVCVYPKRVGLVISAVAAMMTGVVRAETRTLTAVGDVWIRELMPDVTYENDLVSVWSSFNTGEDPGKRRHGLIQFDVGSLAGESLASAHLSLWVADEFSGTSFPLRQHAFVIDSGGTALASLTWSIYLTEKDSGKAALESLGRFDHGVPSQDGTVGTFLVDPGASAADLTLIEAAAESTTGLLTLVFIADEDGTEYRGDWGDIGYAGEPGRLVIETAPPACGLIHDSLPEASQGSPYVAQAALLNDCPPEVRVRLRRCELPPGLSLNGETGLISGTPRYSGTFPLTFQLVDTQSSAILEVSDVDLPVVGRYDGRADFDQDGDVDLEDLDKFTRQFGGERPEPEACDLGSLPSNVLVLEATGDVWIRENFAETTYEGDWVSVWSSSSGDRRYGLIEFDVSALAGQPIQQAYLELWVGDHFSGTQYPLKQHAFVIDSGGTALTGLTWNSFQAEKDASKSALQTLGFYDEPAPSSAGTAGLYLRDGIASAADRALLSAEASGDGVLSLVFVADEDGSHYRGDWGDGTNAGGPGLSEKPGRLVVFTGPSCYVATGDLPEGQVGLPYQAALAAGDDCNASLLWEVAACSLPPGLNLDPSTGVISGTPYFGGGYAFRARVTDNVGGTSSERDLSIEVGTASGDFDRDGDVDANDFNVLQASFTGPLDPDLDLCWREYVKRTLDTLIEYGTDRYGSVHSPILMAILDVNTLDSPQNPPLLDADIRTEGRPDHGRRSPGGSNLWHDTCTIRSMYRMSQLTGDSKYAAAADAYIAAYFQVATKPNGLLYWGSHSYWHAFTEHYGGDGTHETLIKHPEWAELYRVNPAGTKSEVDGMWQWHVWDKVNGIHNRHDDGNPGLDFAFSGGSFTLAFAFMYAQTGDTAYLDEARLLADWHWKHRNLTTNLVPDAPSTTRYDGTHCFTSVTGPYVSQLLRAYEVCGDVSFRDKAIAYVKAYDRYGWNEEAGTYWGMVALDGTPVPEEPPGENYDIWKPTGLIDIWRTTMYSYEMPVEAAEAAVYAYELSGSSLETRDAELLAIARHWARAIEGAMPPQPGRRWKDALEAALPQLATTGGTYAENYGRAISFYVNLYHATGEIQHLRMAKRLAREAVQKLYVNGLFRGHPAKDYYQANDGVGYLLHALLQLDALPNKWRLAF